MIEKATLENFLTRIKAEHVFLSGKLNSTDEDLKVTLEYLRLLNSIISNVDKYIDKQEESESESKEKSKKINNAFNKIKIKKLK